MGVLESTSEWHQQLDSQQQSLIRLTLAPLALYMLWYIWRFNIAPALNPNDPKPLPYLVPCKLP